MNQTTFTPDFTPQVLDTATYPDGGRMTYTQLGNVKGIHYRPTSGMGWEVASSLVEDTDKVWSAILAEVA